MSCHICMQMMMTGNPFWSVGALDKNAALSVSLSLFQFLEWVHFGSFLWYFYAIDKKSVIFFSFSIILIILDNIKEITSKRRSIFLYSMRSRYLYSNWISLLIRWERSWMLIHPEEISLFNTTLQELFFYFLFHKIYPLFFYLHDNGG